MKDSLLADLYEFIHRHRDHGKLTGDASQPDGDGYIVTVACSCGVVFERWVGAEAARDLIYSGLLTKLN